MKDTERLKQKMELKTNSNIDCSKELCEALNFIISRPCVKVYDNNPPLPEVIHQTIGEEFKGTTLRKYQIICKTIERLIKDLSFSAEIDGKTFIYYAQQIAELCVLLGEQYVELFADETNKHIPMVDLIDSEYLVSINIENLDDKEFIRWKTMWNDILWAELNGIENLDRIKMYSFFPYILILVLELDLLCQCYYKKEKEPV